MNFSATIRRQADHDLNERSRLGAVIYFTAWILVVLFTGIEQMAPQITYAFGIYLGFITLLRLVLAARFEFWYAQSATRWRFMFVLLLTASAAPWSLFSAWALALVGLGREGIIVLLPIIMISAGSVFSLTPRRSLYIFFALVFILPQVWVLLTMPLLGSESIAVMLMIFLAFIISVSRNATRDYFDRLDAQQKAEERSAEFAEAKARAESASQIKSQFLANMSHEIRTPLNSVLGVARMGERDHADSGAAAQFHQILESGSLLSRLIDDILDFSRLEAGKLQLDQRAFELRPKLESIMDMLQRLVGDKPIQLKLELAADLPQYIEGDSLRLQQILINLMSNAIKFTAQGSVQLAVTREAAGNGEQLIFKVSDSGIGMSEAQLQRLFTPFQQADSSMTRKYGGSGLGLAISQSLSRLMDARIEVISTPDEGSVFALHLPLRLADQEDVTAPQKAPINIAESLAGVRILAAEDIDINQMILEDILHSAGATFEFVSNGLQAVERVQQNPEKGFDVVLMDVQMPIMDGLEATRHIKQLAPNLPVIALTAHALPEERERCKTCGMAAHVSKPIDPDVLIATIRQQLGLR